MSRDFLPLTRFIGVDYLLSAITIRTIDGFGQPLHLKSICVAKLLRPQCVVAVVKHLNVLATCRKYGTRQT